MLNGLLVALHIINYSIERGNPVTQLKLQKLLYYVNVSNIVREGCFMSYLVERRGRAGVFYQPIDKYRVYMDREITERQNEISKLEYNVNGVLEILKVEYEKEKLKEETKREIEKIVNSYIGWSDWDMVEKQQKELEERGLNEGVISKECVQNYYTKNIAKIYGYKIEKDIEIKVQSRYECEREMKDKRDWIVISIVGLREESIELGSTKKFEIRAEDIEREVQGIRCIDARDVRGLKEFVDRHKGKNIAIHCSAGISRSAGLCLGVLEYKGLDTDMIMKSDRYIPNKKVYEVVCKELGIESNIKQLYEKEEERRYRSEVEVIKDKEVVRVWGIELDLRTMIRTNK